MKKLLVVLGVMISVITVAQNKNVFVEGVAPNLYLAHTVAPKESYFSIGRLYNQAPKLIASFNQLSMEKGLAIGQTIKIPLNSLNMELAGNTVAGETLIPLYHVVAKSETLFRISNNHAAKVEAVKQWNNLSSDNIPEGKALIVGHLRVKNEQLAAFNTSITPSANTNNGTTSTTVITSANDPQAKEKTTIQTVEKTEVNKEETSSPQFTSIEPKKETNEIVELKEYVEVYPKDLKSSPVKTEEKKDTIVNAVAQTPRLVEVKTVPQPEEPQAVKVEAPVAASQASQPSSTTQKLDDAKPLNSMFNEEGEFASLYTERKEGSERTTGVAATFKSTSGWQDKKYYVLINNVEPGTIIKITASDRTVYAKVLGSMPEMKENNGVLLRMSNAAASYLGIIDPKFTVDISY
jgi:LysM repeat protein